MHRLDTNEEKLPSNSLSLSSALFSGQENALEEQVVTILKYATNISFTPKKDSNKQQVHLKQIPVATLTLIFSHEALTRLAEESKQAEDISYSGAIQQMQALMDYAKQLGYSIKKSDYDHEENELSIKLSIFTLDYRELDFSAWFWGEAPLNERPSRIIHSEWVDQLPEMNIFLKKHILHKGLLDDCAAREMPLFAQAIKAFHPLMLDDNAILKIIENYSLSRLDYKKNITSLVANPEFGKLAMRHFINSDSTAFLRSIPRTDLYNLLMLMDEATLFQVQTNLTNNDIVYLLLNHAPEAIAILFNIDDDDYDMLKFKEHFPLFLQPAIAIYLTHEASWQKSDIIQFVLSRLDNLDFYYKRYAEGETFSPLFLYHLKNNASYSNPENKAAYEKLQEEKLEWQSVKQQAFTHLKKYPISNNVNHIYTSDQDVISITAHNISRLLVAYGIYSLHDYHALKDYIAQHDNAETEKLRATLTFLEKQNRLFCPMPTHKDMYRNLASGHAHLQVYLRNINQDSLVPFFQTMPEHDVSTLLQAVDKETKLSGLDCVIRFLDPAHLATFVQSYEALFVDIATNRNFPFALFNLILYQSDIDLISRIANASVLDRNKVNASGDTLIHCALKNKDDNITMHVLKMLREITVNVHHAIDLAVRRSPEIFHYTLQIMSYADYSKACLEYTAEKPNLLELAMQHQPSKMIYRALYDLRNSKSTVSARQYLLSLNKTKHYIIKRLIDFILFDPEWQITNKKPEQINHQMPLLTDLFTIFFEPVEAILKSMLLHGRFIPEMLLTIFMTVKQTREKQNIQQPPSMNDFFLHHTFSTQMFNNPSPIKHIMTSKKTRLEFSDPKFSLTVWHEGFRNVVEFSQARRHQHEIAGLSVILDRLENANYIMQGFIQDLPPESHSDISFDQIHHCLESGKGIAQLIHPEQWKNHLKLLAGEAKAPEAKPTHYYDHLSNEILPLLHEPDPTPWHAVKLIEKTCLTSLSMADEKAAKEVGLIYDLSQVSIKAMLLDEVNTNGQEWLGNLNDVTQYAKKVHDISESDLTQFRAKSKLSQKHMMYVSLLAKAARCIVITHDTPEARHLAIQYANEFKQQFKTTLPIIFYNEQTATLRLYFPEEMERDQANQYKADLCHHPLAEQDAKSRLSLLAADLSSKQDWTVKALIGKSVSKNPVPAANEILTEINNASKNPHTFWSKTKLVIIKKLNQAIKDSSTTEETKAYLKQEKSKYFP